MSLYSPLTALGHFRVFILNNLSSSPLRKLHHCKAKMNKLGCMDKEKSENKQTSKSNKTK